jgi:hypothetical protein
MSIALIAVTVVSVAVASVAGFLLWRMARDERSRSEARVAVLMAELDSPSGSGEPDQWGSSVPFDVYQDHQPPRRATLGAIAAAGAFVLGATLGLVYVVGGSEQAGPTEPATPAASGAEAAPNEPLELLALVHEREADRLRIRGIVRNPPHGAGRADLTAVITLVGEDGVVITTGTTVVQPGLMPPGAETPFVVVVPNANAVSRYRVGFRSDDAAVPHVDRRGSAAGLGAAQGAEAGAESIRS